MTDAARALDPAERGGATTRGRVDLCLGALHFHPVYAGPAIRFRRYAPGFRERGVEMRVFTPIPRDAAGGDGGGDGREPAAPAIGQADGAGEIDRIEGIPVRRVRLDHEKSSKWGWWEYQGRLVELCADPATRPDVLQLLTVDPWSTYYLWRLRRLGVPTVYTHTMLTRMSERPWKRALQRLYWPLPYRFLDCTVVSSSVMRESLREIGVAGRIDVIPNGTDMEAFRPASGPEKRKLRAELGFPMDGPVVLFVGSISPRKGVDVLLEAWDAIGRRHPDAHLALVGPRHDEIRPDEPVDDFFAELEATLERTPASDRVTFTGAVDDVADYYRAADLFVFPSRKEGMPNVVPEAYACGLPVVMTPFQGLPDEFGRDGEHHVLAERTPRALAEAVAGLLDAPARRRELADRARRWAEQELALETALDRYAGLYRELAKETADARR